MLIRNNNRSNHHRRYYSWSDAFITDISISQV